MELKNNFDSSEEEYFSWWLDEAVKYGLILSYEREPKIYNLSDSVKINYHKMLKTKSKIISKSILQPHIYTPDFKIIWNWSFVKQVDSLVDLIESINNINTIFFSSHIDNNVESIVEVKPIYDQNNMTRIFKVNQKWVYEKYMEYVNLIVPEELFKETFTPERYLFTDKTKKKRKLRYNPISITQYLDRVTNKQITLF